MRYHIPDRVLMDIQKFAIENDIRKVILFGSRARGNNGERSDIDLAATGGNVMGFCDDLEEKAWTLLSFDVVNLDRGITDELRKEIDRDGVVIYEKV